MKIAKKVFLCFISAVFSAMLLYADMIFAFPSEIVMFSGQNHNLNMGAGVKISQLPEKECIENEENVIPLKDGEYDATLNVAGAIPFKKIKIKVTNSQSICASGELIGMRIYNNGLIVTETKKIKTQDGKTISPAEEAGIMAGDVIVKVNGVFPQTSETVAQIIKEEENIIEIMRSHRKRTVVITPVREGETGPLLLGIMVRDSTAGVGTVTYYDEDSLTYGALGHGISDSDTGVLFDVQRGTVEKSRVVSVKRGERGSPGEICGSFGTSDGISGTVEKNCECGIFGRLTTNHSLSGKLYPVGLISQINVGDAEILSTVDSEINSYNIKILRTMPFGNTSKGMMIEITDPELLSKTGGIVQGMSGSPIIQNGKLIGAVTHVFVNDPTRGYAIFIENMLSEAEKIR